MWDAALPLVPGAAATHLAYSINQHGCKMPPLPLTPHVLHRLQALYFGSGDLSPPEYKHYGLASEIYTHFTSPIRCAAGAGRAAPGLRAALAALAALPWVSIGAAGAVLTSRQSIAACPAACG